MAFQIKKIFVICAILGFFSLFAIPAFTFAQQIGNITNQLNASNLKNSNGNLVDLVQNPIFTLVNLTTALPSDWNDIFSSCATDFRCEINTTNGWFDNQSFQISTQNNTNGTWSWISSQGIDVQPSENYEILTHMKLNEWATQSHVLLDGYNETSQQWYEIEQCPHGSNGPMDWMEFRCSITIPPATSTIVVILNAGWSSQMNNDAITLFDGIHMFKSSDTKSVDNQTISSTNTNNNESSALDKASSNNLDNNIKASRDNTNNPENYDNLEELVKDIKNGVVNSEEISLSAFQDSGAYLGADQETQDCIDLAGKIGDNLGDQEIVNCSEDPDFYKNEISNKQ